ncbi:MAG TPA: PAS domain S-box protein [Pyrinomonadaceae bacterium]|nr:PAS domain S-box protein [Pyrinomonadaceae bacterium]
MPDHFGKSDTSIVRNHVVESTFARYGVALLCVAAAFFIRLALDPLLGDHFAFLTLYGGIAVAVWFGGWRPALLATLIGFLLTVYFFVEPRLAFAFTETTVWAGFIGYLLSCGFIIYMGETMHRARQRAEQQAQLLNAIVAFSGDAIITKDLTGNITSWNDSAQRLFGFEAKEMIGKPVTVLFPTDRLHEEDAILERLRQGEASAHLETVRLTKDGRRIPVYVSVSPMKDPQGKVTGASKIIQDVTEIVAAREQLTREKELLATTLASIGDAVILTDAAGRVTFLNKEAERLTGWTNAEANGRALNEVFQIINEQTRQPVENPVDKVMRFGGVVGLANHTILITRDGREIPIDDSAAPIRQSDGPLFGIVLVFRDFSDRKLAEEKLRQKEAELEAIIHRTPFMLTRCSRDLQYQFVSRTYAEMLGLRPEDIAGKPIVEIMGQDGLDTIAPHIERVLSGEQVEYESEVSFKDGGKPYLRVFYTPDRDQEGNVIGWIASIVDITDRKRVEKHREELLAREQELRQVAEEANRLKDEFLAIMSHELRNPLNVVLGYSEILVRSDQVGQSSQLRRMAEAIKRNAKAQSKLISDLLDLSRLRSGKLELNQQTVSLVASANNAIDTVHSDAEVKQIVMTFSPPDESLFVEADPVRLEQVIWNLLNNAVKFTPAGGHIAIRMVKEDDQVVLEVEDNGQGIHASFLPHVFELFRQADATTSRSQPGMGIGLAVVKQLVDLHNGSITAHSEGLGKGSTFTVRLPLSDEIKPQLEPVSDITTVLDKFSILVVDDSEDTTEMLSQLLKVTGATVTSATSGQTALRIIAEKEFDVVLSDISMPEMDGFEFLRRLRQLPGRAEVPVLALTGYGRPEDIERAQREGFFSHVTKPFDINALLQVLKRIQGDSGPSLGSVQDSQKGRGNQSSSDGHH